LHLGTGHVRDAVNLLDTLEASAAGTRIRRLAGALRLLIAAVKFQDRPSARHAQSSTATEWLAESYFQQSRSDLEAARDAARQAVLLAPEFGFALARLAELEFGFGRIAAAEKALE